MSRHNQLSSYRTTIAADDAGTMHVTYVKTRIVSWDAKTVTLRSGGWDTVTTRRKMNQASRQFSLGFSVWQRNFETFVDLPSGETVDFKDGMSFARHYHERRL